MNVLTYALQAIGSLFIKSNAQSGPAKQEVAVVPTAMLLYLVVGASCMVQTSEPFSQCVKTVASSVSSVLGVGK